MKNCLLFVPILAAHQIPDVVRSCDLLMAFLSFSLCASAVYLANDLLDLDSDRQHPRKKFRPFASGQLSVVTGVLLAPLLLIAAMWLGLQIPGQFLGWLIFYFILTCAYSLLLKRVVLIDCLTLAVLYTVRLIAGASAASMSLSFWLLAFAVFLFLSLAFVKRYAELEIQLLSGKEKTHGRGYFTSDASLVQTLGVTAGFSAVLVLALYLNSEAVVKLYKAPEIIWGAVPVMLFWISWMWMQAHRGKMHDDPLVFALKDKASLSAGIVFALVLLAGAGGWPW
jgi:4-hydroxybenzoate polyprenyltransferase